MLDIIDGFNQPHARVNAIVATRIVEVVCMSNNFDSRHLGVFTRMNVENNVPPWMKVRERS